MSQRKEAQEIYNAILAVAKESSNALKNMSESVQKALDGIIKHLNQKNEALLIAAKQLQATQGSVVDHSVAIDQAKKFGQASDEMSKTNQEVARIAARMALISGQNIEPGLAKNIKATQDNILGKINELNAVAQKAHSLMQQQAMLLGNGKNLTESQMATLDSSIEQFVTLNAKLKQQVTAQAKQVARVAPEESKPTTPRQGR